MNRLTLLASIHRQLRESQAETGEERPLGEIVARVATEIRTTKPTVNGASRQVIPIEQVAAFVDGDLDTDEEQHVADAALIDNSVLAELVSAVRATHVALDELPALPFALNAQLNAMLPAVRSSPLPAEPETTASLKRRESFSIQADHETSNPPHGKRNKTILWGGIAAVATTIVAALIWLNREQLQPEVPALPDRSIAEDSSTSPDDLTPPPESIVSPNESSPVIVDNSSSPMEEDGQPKNEKPSSEVIVQQDRPPTIQQAANDPPPPSEMSPAPLDAPSKTKMINPDEASIVMDQRKPHVEWTDVVGVLAERSTVEPNATTSAPIWKPILSGRTGYFADDRPNPRVSVRTLPFSRAVGSFSNGGELIVRDDSGISMLHDQNETSIDLQYGAVALIDFGSESNVVLQQAGQRIASLQWQTNASVVVQRMASGIQIQVNRGEVNINNDAVRDRSVEVTIDQTIKPLRAPRRLPQWVNQRPKNTPAEDLILAQLAKNANPSLAVHRKIVELSSIDRPTPGDVQLAGKLAAWEVGLAGANLYRLSRSPVPMVRLAVFQRLTTLPESDPRHARVWQVIGRSVNDAQRVNQMRTWFRMVQNGVRPNRAQMEQMATDLSGRDISSRATADFILRNYVTDAPPFDPSWTGQKLQRAVNIYRQRAGLAVRPSGAANSAAN